MHQPNNHPIPPDQHLALEKHIDDLVITLEKLNSWRRRLLLGIIHGVGTALGATIIAAIIIYLIVNAMRALGFEGLLEALNLEHLIPQPTE